MEEPSDISKENRQAPRTAATTQNRTHMAPTPKAKEPTVLDRMAAGLSAAQAIQAQDATGHKATFGEKNKAKRQEESLVSYLRDNPALAKAIASVAGQILESRFQALFESALPPILHGLAVNLGSEAPTEENLLMAVLDGTGAYWIKSGEAGTFVYTSYFRLIDATETLGSPSVGVTNGSAAMLDPVGKCGAVKINGVRADTDAVATPIGAAGTYHVWIQSWIDATGEFSGIIVGTVNIDTPPDKPSGAIAYASQLAGRVTVEDVDGDLTITSITQDFLRGGEHAELLFGDCSGTEIQCVP